MYTLRMAKKKDEARTETLSVKVPPEFRDELDRVAGVENRTLSQTSYMLIQRGLDAYKKDGLLITPISAESHNPYEVLLKKRSAPDIAAETGINIITVSKVIAEQLEGVDPQDVEIIQTALKEKPGGDNISPLRIKNGR
jgi:hypothetical protein